MPSKRIILNVIIHFYDPTIQVIILYRLSHFFWYKLNLHYLANIISALNLFLTGASIRATAMIGEKISFPHPNGVVIGDYAHIGKNVTILQHVTIGKKGGKVKGIPLLKDNILVGAGAVLMGPITINSDVTIGANSVVTKDVPAHSTVYGVNICKQG